MSLYIGNNKIGKVIVGTQESGGGINTDDATLTSGAQMLSPYTSYSKGTKYTGTIPTRTDSNMTVSGNTVTAAAGYYADAASKSIPTVSLADPTINVNASGLITASVSQTAGYVATSQSSNTRQLGTQAAKTVTPGDSAQTAVQAGLFTTGNVTVAAVNADETTITANGTYTPETGSYFNSVVVNVPTGGGSVSLQSKSATPTESSQTIVADSGFDGLSSVEVGAISSTYVGSGVSRQAAATITPSSSSQVAVAQGKYTTGAVTVSAVPTETKSITANGTYTPTSGNYFSSVTVNVEGDTFSTQAKSASPTESEVVVTPDSGYDGLSSVTVSPISSTYVGSGITRRDGTDLSVDDEIVLVAAGYYEESCYASVGRGIEGTPTATKGAVSNHSISITPSVTNTTGWIAGNTQTGTAVSVSASELVSGTLNVTGSGTQDVTNYASASIPAGTATAPSTISGSSATVNTGTNTLTLSKTVSVTPNVSTAGYISSGTAGNSSVSLTASVTTKAAATYYPSTSDQTISASQYLTGAQTIKGVTVSGLSADKILSGTTVKIGDSADDDRITSVMGTVVIQHYYTGSSTPSSSLGSDGDIYLRVVS